MHRPADEHRELRRLWQRLYRGLGGVHRRGLSMRYRAHALRGRRRRHRAVPRSVERPEELWHLRQYLQRSRSVQRRQVRLPGRAHALQRPVRGYDERSASLRWLRCCEGMRGGAGLRRRSVRRRWSDRLQEPDAQRLRRRKPCGLRRPEHRSFELRRLRERVRDERSVCRRPLRAVSTRDGLQHLPVHEHVRRDRGAGDERCLLRQRERLDPAHLRPRRDELPRIALASSLAISRAGDSRLSALRAVFRSPESMRQASKAAPSAPPEDQPAKVSPVLLVARGYRDDPRSALVELW